MVKFFPYIRSNANFRTKQNGNYNDYTTWEIQGPDGNWYSSPYFPYKGNNITVAHTVALTENEYCNTFVVTTGSITYNGFTLNQSDIPGVTNALIETASSSVLQLTFSLAVNITTAGWSIATDGASLSISSVLSGSGTTTPKFQLSRAISEGEVITISYSQSTGNTVGTISGIEISNLSNYSVTNDVAGLTLATPDNFEAHGTEVDEIGISWDSVLSATSYTLEAGLESNFSDASTIYTGSGTNFDHTGLDLNQRYYYRVKATAVGYSDSAYATTSATSLLGVLYQGGNVYDVGDSYPYGQGASPSSNSYMELLKDYLVANRTSYSAGGSGSWRAASQSNANFNQRTYGLILYQNGFNDVRRQTDLARTLVQIQGAYRIMLMNAFAKKYYQANAFAQTGTWNGVSPGAGFGNKYNAPNNAGAGTLTATISGKNFGISLLGASGDTFTFGTLQILVDSIEVFNSSMNTKYSGDSDGVYDNTVGPWGIFILGLSAGSHTFEFISDNSTPIDFVAELVDYPADYANAVVVLGLPLMPDDGYLVSPSNADESMIIDANEIISAVVDEIKALYPVSFVHIDALNKATDFDADDVHLNNSGHAKVAGYIEEVTAINEIIPLFNQVIDIVYWNGSFQSRNQDTWQSYGLSSLYLPASTDGYVQFDIENLGDARFGIVGLNTTETLETYSGYEYGAALYTDNSIKRLTNGGDFNTIEASPTIGGKVRLGRFGGTMKIRYAADGSSFSDLYTWSANSSAFYLNIAMVEDSKAYGMITSGFVTIP